MTLRTLQCGRGFAAIAVVAFHLSALLGLERYGGVAVFRNVTWRGNLGVDFFFVLSGFTILLAHHRDVGRPERLWPYLAKRFIRLFPIYWLYVGLFCMLAAVGFGSGATVPRHGSEWLSTLLLVRTGAFELPIAPAWTLIHEVAFYLIFALTIVSRRLGLAALAVWLSSGLVVFSHAEEGARSALTTYLSPLNVNFAIGMGAYLAWKRSAPRLLKALAFVGLALVAACLFRESAGVAYARVQLVYAVAFGLIVAGAAAWERDSRFVGSWGLLARIGDASYTIYLTHLALLGLFAKIVLRFAPSVGLPAQVGYGLILGMTIASGYLVYVFVERPLLRWCRAFVFGSDPSPRRRAWRERGA